MVTKMSGTCVKARFGKALTLVFVLVLTGLVSTSALAQESRTLGIVSEQTQQEPLAQIQELIGDWDITVDMIDENGAVSARFNGEWNFFYILGGTAVQDAFFLPARSVTLPDESARFVGTGLRTFNPADDVWEASWVDSGSRMTEHWNGSALEGKLVFTREAGAVLQRSSYWVEAGQFHWHQEESHDQGQSWTLTQTALGERGD